MSLLTAELRAMVGRTQTYTAPEPLGRASIRYFARAVGDDNPLYLDDEFARQHGYDGVIAPPSLICETGQYCDLPRGEDGYAGHAWAIEVPGTRAVRGGNSYEFHRPVRPDDVVTARWEIIDLAERTTGTGAPMLVVTSAARYLDASGELLCTNTETIIYVGSTP